MSCHAHERAPTIPPPRTAVPTLSSSLPTKKLSDMHRQMHLDQVKSVGPFPRTSRALLRTAARAHCPRALCSAPTGLPPPPPTARTAEHCRTAPEHWHADSSPLTRAGPVTEGRGARKARAGGPGLPEVTEGRLAGGWWRLAGGWREAGGWRASCGRLAADGWRLTAAAGGGGWSRRLVGTWRREGGVGGRVCGWTSQHLTSSSSNNQMVPFNTHRPTNTASTNFPPHT